MGDVVRKVKGGRFIGWYVRYRDADGRRKQRASHQPSFALARRYLLEIEGRIARGLIGIPEPAPPPPTVNALVERFLGEYSRPRIKDLEKYRMYARTALRRALPVVGLLRADAVTAADVERLRQSLARSCAPSSVRVTLDFLKAAFGWAVKIKLIEQNPLRGVEKPPVTSALDYLSQAEVCALLQRSEQRALSGDSIDRLRHVCIQLALHTGLRRGELFGLRWIDLDLTTRRLTVARSYRTTPKGGKPRHLRLPDAVVYTMYTWRGDCPKSPEGLVFPVAADTLGIHELLREAGCRPLPRPWHALRHTFASHFIMSGGNILSLQKILGHSDIKMTLIYAHLAPDFLSEEMNKVKYR